MLTQVDNKAGYAFRMCLFMCAFLGMLFGCSKYDPNTFSTGLDCSTIVPFYELQDTSSKSLFVQCDCLNSGLDIGPILNDYTQVQSLGFDCNQEKFDEIPSMPSVESLISNVITSNVLAFQNLKKYQNRTYSTYELSTELSQLPKLTDVVLQNAMSFPSFFMYNRTLDVFKMTYQGMPEQEITVPTNISTLTTLKELNIIDIDLTLFTNFDRLVKLERLKVINGAIARIPDSPNQWPNLKLLELSNITIRGGGNLPDIFEQMDSLEAIYIGETPLTTSTQTNIYKAPNVKELTFSYCEVSSILPEIANMNSLEKLVITTDKSALIAPISLPQSLGSMSNLKSISLSTGSTNFPSELLGLTSTLETLALTDALGTLPTEIGNFSALQELLLANCGLSNLPSSIQNLSNTLLTLDLTNNNISESNKQQILLWLPNTQIIF